MSRMRIIGIATPFGDDRIGWDALDAMKQGGVLDQFPAGWATMHYCDPPASVLSLLSGASGAILIDAMRGGASPGTIKKLDVNDLQPDPRALSSHSFGVAESLALGRELGLLPPRLILYGIEAESCSEEQGVSDQLRKTLPELTRSVATDLQQLFQAYPAA